MSDDDNDTQDVRRPKLLFGGKGFLGTFTANSLVCCFLGRPLLFVGLVLVIVGRGCDGVSMRSVGRANAGYAHAKALFDNEWSAKAAPISQKINKKQREINELQKKGEKDDKKSEALSKEIKTLGEDLQKIQTDMHNAQSDKEIGEWRPLQEAAGTALTGHQKMVYWYELLFIFGSIVLVMGILIVAFTGEGAERWIGYIMIAILTFSLYVGGAAWFESIYSSLHGMEQPVRRGPGPGG